MPSPVMTNPKKRLRDAIRAAKTQHLSPFVRERAEALLCERWKDEVEPGILRAAAAKHSVPTVLLYAALPDEVPTHGLITTLCRLGWHVVLPCVAGPAELDLKLCRSIEDLVESGPYHIPEPRGPIFTDLAALDFALIPGMAFDRQGHRLGRGKGYYDRLLANPFFDSIPKVGLCYDFQLLSQVPAAPHDRPVDGLIVIPTV